MSRDPRDVTDVFSRVDHDELKADAFPLSFTASEVLDGTTFVARVTLHLDRRVRLGLLVMKLGARIMGSRLESKSDAGSKEG